MKNWFESRTLWIGVAEVLIGCGGLLATFLEAGDYTAPAIVLLVVGFMKIGLRLITVQPIDSPLV